jgi:thioredoxin 1
MAKLLHLTHVNLQTMKKVYFILGTLAALVLSAYALNACGNTAKPLAADEQPVDLNQPKVTEAAAEGAAIPVAEFDKTIKESKLSMVDFYTTWCGPCKRMAPSVIKIKKEMADVVNVMQIDAEAQADISGRYNIEAYPTLVFFKKGQVVGNVVGLQTYEQIVEFVNKLK